jgi:glycosyltransferase involved in cell wall biosynthesis
VLLSLPPRRAAWALAWWGRNLRRLHRARRAAVASRSPHDFARAAPAARQDVGSGPATVRTTASQAASRRGINVVGWVDAPTGVGQAARGTLAALRTAGLPHATWSLDDERELHARTSAEGAPFDVTVMHVNADMMEVITERLPRWVTAGRHRVGYWFWELAHFPLAFAPAFALLDEVWAPTRFCLEAYRPIAPVPVRWVPPSVPIPTAAPSDRAALGVAADAFLLLFAFDARSVPERKNPAALLRALRLAVQASPRPLHLLLKVNHAEENAALLADLGARAAGLPVTLLTRAMTRANVDGLLAACDAYSSLHRSEGLGLPLIEAMMLGKPVLATGYGGCTDFLDEKTGWVVRHSLVALERAHGPYPPGAVWAEPDVEHAAEQLLRLVHDAEARRQRAALAQRRVVDLYAPEAAGGRLHRELERILAQRGGAPLAVSRPHAAATLPA